MINLWYPKQSPIITLAGMGGGATSLGISRGGPPSQGADTGDGYGYSIDEGADDTESNSITSDSSTYHMSTWSFADSGSGSQGTLTDYDTGNITVDCGSQAGHWPFYLAVKVSSADKGRVINQIEWNRGSIAIGSGKVYGSNWADIDSTNFNDETNGKWSFIGDINMGGTNNGSTGNGNSNHGTYNEHVSRCLFNPNSYGYQWIMIKFTDSNGAGTYGPPVSDTGVKASFHMYGMRLNYFNVGGAVGSNKIFPSFRWYKYEVDSSTHGHNPMTTTFYGKEDSFSDYSLLKNLGGTSTCADNGSWNYAEWTSNDLGSNKQIMNIFAFSNFGGGRRGSRFTLKGSTDNSNWTTMYTGHYDTGGSCGWRSFGGKRWWT